MAGLVFNRWPMRDPRSGILSCVEHERLEFELLDVRTRRQYLMRLRGLRREQLAEWDRREKARRSRDRWTAQMQASARREQTREPHRKVLISSIEVRNGR